MTTHLVVGAGAVGRATARALLARDPDQHVVLASRAGTGPDVPGVRRRAVDAADAAALRAAADEDDVEVVYNCLNPPYHRWEQEWPPLAAALLAAAEGRTLVTMANLYVYGRVDGPMREDTPERPNGHKGEVRRRMTEDALAAHAAGRLRYAEARASDFFGPGTDTTSYLTGFVFGRARRGKRVVLPMGDVDAPHSWTYVPDVGATLAALGTDPHAAGRVWHVPPAATCSVREVAADVARRAGLDAPGANTVPWPVVRAAGVAVPFLRELGETRHQFTRPFVVDATAIERELGVRPTAWDEALDASLAALAA